MFSANELWKCILLVSVLNANVQSKSKQSTFAHLDTKLQCQLTTKYSVCTKYISFQRCFTWESGLLYTLLVKIAAICNLFYHHEGNIDAEFQ